MAQRAAVDADDQVVRSPRAAASPARSARSPPRSGRARRASRSGPSRAQPGEHQRRRRAAVDVVVGEDRDPLAALHRRPEAAPPPGPCRAAATGRASGRAAPARGRRPPRPAARRAAPGCARRSPAARPPGRSPAPAGPPRRWARPAPAGHRGLDVQEGGRIEHGASCTQPAASASSRRRGRSTQRQPPAPPSAITTARSPASASGFGRWPKTSTPEITAQSGEGVVERRDDVRSARAVGHEDEEMPAHQEEAGAAEQHQVPRRPASPRSSVSRCAAAAPTSTIDRGRERDDQPGHLRPHAAARRGRARRRRRRCRGRGAQRPRCRRRSAAPPSARRGSRRPISAMRAAPPMRSPSRKAAPRMTRSGVIWPRAVTSAIGMLASATT